MEISRLRKQFILEAYTQWAQTCKLDNSIGFADWIVEQPEPRGREAKEYEKSVNPYYWHDEDFMGQGE